MKKVLMLSLAVGIMLAITSQVFAMVEKPPIIEKNLGPRYENIKILL